MDKPNILIASDHAGFTLKEHLKNKFKEINWIDLGPTSEDRVDYPDFADKLATHINTENTRGVLVCGSGQGMAIRANRYPHIRAALCWSSEVAELSRLHNDANVLCLGSRVLDFEVAEKTLTTFLNTDFEGGRHQGRVEKMSAPIKEK